MKFRLLCAALIGFVVLFGWGLQPTWAQMGATGTLSIIVQDQSGAVMPGASLMLREISTNSTRTASAQNSGSYTFVGLPPGTYELTVSKRGFQTQVFTEINVQAAGVTDVKATLNVGAVASRVTVTAQTTPIIAVTSNAIGTTISMKSIQDLPLPGRDVSQLAFLTPGFTGAPNYNGGQQGTWNGLPQNAQGNNVNGVLSSSSRMKFSGNGAPAISARIESMQEMTVSTDQLDLNQGYGQADMQVNYVTKRGSNSFHGSAFEDFRNTALNANSWTNNAVGLPVNKLILNEFGGTFGGPILKNKLFFFGTFEMSKQPGSYTTSDTFLTPAAQAGNVTITNASGSTQTLNVLSQIAQANGLPSGINSAVAAQQQLINGSLGAGKITPTSDPNINTISWLVNSPTTYYYPSIRVDYSASTKLHFDVNWIETKQEQPNVSPGPFPGSGFADRIASNRNNNYTAGLGIDYTISPNLLNQFQGGYLYDASWYAYDAKPLWDTEPAIDWAIANSGVQLNSGNAGFNLPITTYYPVVSAADNVTWVHGSHTLQFGFSYYREQDHYWNNPLGYPIINLGLNSQDPAASAFNNSPLLANATTASRNDAENVYASLAGRISGVSGQFALNKQTHQYYNTVGAYNLNELQKAWGLYAQDSFKMRPNLTLNYGLRWDFVGDDHDLTGAYTSALPADLYGPSGLGNIFKPGTLTGETNPTYVARSHAYNPWNVTPQPAFGFAWNPKGHNGLLGTILGGDGTVLRGGFAIRNVTESNQFFWNDASNFGFNYYNSFSLTPAFGGGVGTFTPGSLALGDTLPPYFVTPQTFQNIVPQASQTFFGYWSGVNGMNPKIRQPYVESWNFGIQRQVGQNNVLEVRYVGNVGRRLWIQLNPNEANIFENGFLKEFKGAQANLAINAANGVSNSFADMGFPGESALPILTTAGVSPTDGTSIYDMQTGQAGAMAQMLANTPNYLCSMIGNANFSPCNGFASGAGAYPLNFWQANPFAAGVGSNGPGTETYMTDAGYSSFNSLQVDFRQKPWHGMQFDVNYTWSSTLGLQPGNSWTGAFDLMTMRNLNLSYGPTLYDLPNVLHVYGTYDLPFGRGKAFLNHGGVLNKVVGGWTVGTILTISNGYPFQLNGGYKTFNDYADGGTVLNGVTAAQLKSSIGVYPVPGFPFANIINPKYLSSTTGGGANSTYITPNSAAGTLGYNPWLWAPTQLFDDIAVTKAVPIREDMNLTFQGEFINAFNHPVWGNPDSGVQDFGFGESGTANTYAPRIIELRANFNF